MALCWSSLGRCWEGSVSHTAATFSECGWIVGKGQLEVASAACCPIPCCKPSQIHSWVKAEVSQVRFEESPRTEIPEPLWAAVQRVFPHVQSGDSCSNFYLLLVILLLCFCSSEENLAVLSLTTPPSVEEGSEVSSLPALPQALQAQISHAHHSCHCLCSNSWPSLWPPLGSLQFANSSLVLRGPKAGHNAPDATIRGAEQMSLLAALWLMHLKRQLVFTAHFIWPAAHQDHQSQSCRGFLPRRPSLSCSAGLPQLRHEAWHLGPASPFLQPVLDPVLLLHCGVTCGLAAGACCLVVEAFGEDVNLWKYWNM